MLILFLVLITLGVSHSDPYDTRSKAANAAMRNIDASGMQRQPGANRGQIPNEGLISQDQNYEGDYGAGQDTGVPIQGYPVPPENINPSETEYAAINPNGYSTINVGNGSGKKNTVILNHGKDKNDDQLLVGINKHNQYNPDVQGVPYNNNAGSLPCYQNGVPIQGYPCNDGSDSGTQYPGPSNHPKTYNIGNGHNNENVVTINGGGRGSLGYASRGAPGGHKQNKQPYDISTQRLRSQGNGIKAVYVYIMTLLCAHMMMLRP